MVSIFNIYNNHLICYHFIKYSKTINRNQKDSKNLKATIENDQKMLLFVQIYQKNDEIELEDPSTNDMIEDLSTTTKGEILIILYMY